TRVRLASSLAAALLDGLFEHPAKNQRSGSTLLDLTGHQTFDKKSQSMLYGQQVSPRILCGSV
ncbi:MAG: hypothetical protein ABL983_22415, partial [Nitrospira sp.]